MATAGYASVALLALSSLLLIAVLSAKPTRNGFTLPLIPRESPNSPLHNLNHSYYTQIQSAIARSKARAKHFSKLRFGAESKSSEPESQIIVSDTGEYLINISLGTPAFPVLAIADTGSDLIWTQCEPCDNCYKQKAPLFDSTKSSTYQPVSCYAPQCTTGVSGFNPSCHNSNKCQYSVAYGDQSTSNGAIATETLTLGSSSFPKTVFGCGFDNQGTFSAAGSGIVGLGNGPVSLIGQLDKTIGGKFSYCLVPLSSRGTKSSQINFGDNAVVSGDGVVSTPLITKDPPTFYYLTLNSITVGDEEIPFTGGSGSSKADADGGNIIIDSGTTLLILTQDFYDAVTAEIQKQVDAKPVDDPSSELGLCYNAEGFKAPELVANFDGADVKLNDFNAWLAISDTTVCFAASPSDDDIAIYGNVAQMNFLVGYDKEGQTVSFKPADCTQSN
ncbi:hypothetical protein QQ045_009071 [Rhodiola kirilowii]